MATIRNRVAEASPPGLTSEEAHRRLARYGENALREEKVSLWRQFFAYFWGPIPWMIETAAILSAAVRHWEDFILITALLFINAGVGFWQEFKADTAIAQLKKQLALKATVLRDGRWQEVPARQLVPGDVIQVKIGNIIPADARLLNGEYLSVDQSALTGESLPVDKRVGDTVYSGSVAKLGEMTAQVTSTGMQTYIGKTARLVERPKNESHFQRAVLRIGNFLIFTTIGLVLLILVVALFRHDPWVDTLLFALILTVAAIPVALPAVLSVTMAVGAERLAKMQAIVSRLVSIEELASIDTLCADKTGTLTKNQLTLGNPVLLEAPDLASLMLAAALATEANSQDAIDIAILQGLPDRDALKGYDVTRFRPFDPVAKRTEATVTHGDQRFNVSKGAPQVILALTRPQRALTKRVEQQTVTFAQQGYRTIAVAQSNERGHWQLLGLLPLFDPPRDDSKQAVQRIQELGIHIKMVTGDHLAIAQQIARQLGLGPCILQAGDLFEGRPTQQKKEQLVKADGFAQVFPEHKFEIVKTLQTEKQIVGMTGDGVNDAPALKRADVGIAVSGATDAARSAADLVLTAEGLQVIARAIEEARRIFERMLGYAIYRIAETLRVLSFMTLSILIFNFYPVTAVMIVLLALLNDFPIMMIAYDNTLLVKQPVRWDMPRVLTISALLGGLGVMASFGLFWLAISVFQLPRETVQTLIFLKLLVAGHLTIYLTRNTGAIWQRPWPSWKLITACETTQLVGTLAAVYGWFVEPIGWGYALLVWGYALVWFFINSLAKIMAYRLMGMHASHQTRHLARTEQSLHGS